MVGSKRLSETMMINLLMHICVTQPQSVNSLWLSYNIVLHKTSSSSVQLLACCSLVAYRHYWDKCLLITKVTFRYLFEIGINKFLPRICNNNNHLRLCFSACNMCMQWVTNIHNDLCHSLTYGCKEYTSQQIFDWVDEALNLLCDVVTLRTNEYPGQEAAHFHGDLQGVGGL